MADVRPFRGIRYNPELIKDYSEVLAPPYDVINSSDQDKLYQRHDNNIVRVILPKGKGDEKYMNAAQEFQDWLNRGILTRDNEPSIYPYYQEFEESGRRLTRKGFIALIKLEDFTSKKILPHERTFPKHKEDRLKLTKACNANLSQIFSIYSDIDCTIEELIDSNIPGDPIIDTVDDLGVTNRFWRITDGSSISKITKLMADKTLLIADGHHRYETALNYKEYMKIKSNTRSGENPFDYVNMFLSCAEGQGLVINPTHRAVKEISGHSESELLSRISNDFEVHKIAENDINNIQYNEIIMVSNKCNSFYKLASKNGNNDSYNNIGVMSLHRLIFNKIIDEEKSGILYTKYLNELMNLVKTQGYDCGFVLPPLKAKDIFDVVLSNERMPHKTTYFYPKILSGLVINPLW